MINKKLDSTWVKSIDLNKIVIPILFKPHCTSKWCISEEGKPGQIST